MKSEMKPGESIMVGGCRVIKSGPVNPDSMKCGHALVVRSGTTATAGAVRAAARAERDARRHGKA